MAIRVRRLARRGFIGGLAVFSAGFAAPLPELEADQSGARARIAGLGAGAVPPLERLHPRLPPASLSAADRGEWMMFQRRFVAPDGRVIDTNNGGVSHSEGQGWGLLLAESFDDPATFDLILGWTERHLAIRSDALHAWRYQPGRANPVSDTNNATDGDIYIAAALARAALRWNRPELMDRAGAIGRDILSELVREVGGRLVLLPGAWGFEKRTGVTVNLSYYAFGLLPYVEAAAPSPLWQRLRDDGIALVEAARFGPWGLPPDWLEIDPHTGALRPAPAWPARFSYDAIRVPLHLAWGGLADTHAARALRAYWVAMGPGAPAWIDLATGQAAPYRATAGMRAVAALLASAEDGEPPALPSVAMADDYYAAGLIMLARLATRESEAARGL
jgi:endoglucanase